MKKVILAVIILASASACTVRSERTVVEKPVPAPATAAVVTPVPSSAVVVTDPAPAATVYVPAR